MNTEIQKELQEIEGMVQEAKVQEKYEEKYFILREGMLCLTGGFAQAALLSSLLSWTRHWLKTDNEVYKWIQEAAKNNDLKKIQSLKKQIRQGWFWKSYPEMSKDLIGMVKEKTCERYVKKFEENGWLHSREPEQKATYRARWYKVDISAVREALQEIGFDLNYFKRKKQETPSPSIGQNDGWENSNFDLPNSQKNPLNSTGQNDGSSSQNDGSSSQNDGHLLYSSFTPSSFTPDDDDDAPKKSISASLETNHQYLAFNELFKKAGAEPIKNHLDHLPKYIEAVKKVGFARLMQAAEKFINADEKWDQIVYFLSGTYNRYVPTTKVNERRSKPYSKKQKTKSSTPAEIVPASQIKQWQQAQTEVAATNQDEEWDKINDQLRQWNMQKKHSSSSHS